MSRIYLNADQSNSNPFLDKGYTLVIDNEQGVVEILNDGENVATLPLGPYAVFRPEHDAMFISATQTWKASPRRDPRETTLSWSVQGTGGGCDGLMADWGTEGGYCLITAVDDPSAPESDEEEVGLGIYTADGEPLYWGAHPNTPAAKQFAEEWLDNAYNGGCY